MKRKTCFPIFLALILFLAGCQAEPGIAPVSVPTEIVAEVPPPTKIPATIVPTATLRNED